MGDLDLVLDATDKAHVVFTDFTRNEIGLVTWVAFAGGFFNRDIDSAPLIASDARQQATVTIRKVSRKYLSPQV